MFRWNIHEHINFEYEAPAKETRCSIFEVAREVGGAYGAAAVPEDSFQPPSLDDLRSTDAAINNRAWGKIYPVFWNDGMKLANLKLGGEQWREDRKDVIQIAIAQCHNGVMGQRFDGTPIKGKSFDQLRDFADLRRMFFAILRRRIIDFYKKKREISLDEEELIIVMMEEETQNILGNDDLTGGSDLWPLVKELKPPKPLVFREFFWEGYTAEEVSQRLQMSRNTVVSHLYRGYKQLRKMLETSS